jgi:enoyl-CoA hydratase/carnithine racemase
VLVGAGSTFCAGIDLTQIARPGHRADPTAASRLFGALRQTGPVLIAAVEGYALGLGSGLAMACDLVIAADDATFGYPEIRHDLVAGVTMVGLREIVGPRRAMEYLVTGRQIGAHEANDVGMVNQMVPSGDAFARSLSLAGEIAQHSTPAVQMTRQLLHGSAGASYVEAIEVGEAAVLAARADRLRAATTDIDRARDRAHSEGAP